MPMLLRRLIPADLLTPLSAFLALKPCGASLLLESCDLGERVGRHSFVLMQGKGEVRLAAPATGWVEALRALAAIAPIQSEPDSRANLPGPRDAFPIGVGCAGYVGFEAIGALEPWLPLPLKNSMELPAVWLRRFDGALVFDHLHQVAELQVLCADRSQGLARLEELAEQLTYFVAPVEPKHQTKATAQLSQAQYEAFVKAAQERILDGDVYQLVPSQRVKVVDPPSPLEAYRRLRRLNPSPYAFLLEWGEFALVGASPEMLVRVQGREAETLPIAGTVARGGSDEDDAQRFEDLKRNPKELAEHQMLVDLARNDLGRIAVPGSVRVPEPARILDLPYVHHLVAVITAQVRPATTWAELLAATFPAGSITGAPKRMAMELITQYEAGPRGAYCGTFGWVGADAAQLAVAIRTLTVAGSRVTLHAGSGIVADSDGAAEWDEVRAKASAMATALGGTV